MIALGVANIGSGLLGGLAGGGSLSQSAVNDGAGARPQVSTLVGAVLILVTVLVLTPLFTDLPEAVLAALIIHAVSHLWKIAEFRRYYHQARAEFWLGLATMIGVITIDVLPGLIIGVVSMLLLLVFRASRPHISVLARVPGTADAFGDVDRHPDYERLDDVLVLRLDAPLSYGNATPVRDAIKLLVGTANPTPTAVILDGGAIDRLDITTTDMLKELIPTMRAGGVDFALADVRLPAIEMADRSGLLELIGKDRIFHTIEQALQTVGNQGSSEVKDSG